MLANCATQNSALAHLQALQEELSSLQEPANVIHIQICNQANVNFTLKISGINIVALYDTGTNMRCMPYTCYMKLKHPTSLKMISAISVHSALGHDFCSYDWHVVRFQ